MSHDLVDVHDVAVFVMEVEEVDLVGRLAAVEDGFFGNQDAEVVVERFQQDPLQTGGTWQAAIVSNWFVRPCLR